MPKQVVAGCVYDVCSVCGLEKSADNPLLVVSLEFDVCATCVRRWNEVLDALDAHDKVSSS